MRSYRLTITSVLGIVLVVALGLALLRVADEFWASVAYALAILAALVAAMGAMFADRGLRAFCAGFATFSAVYLILVFRPFSTGMEPPVARPGGSVPPNPPASLATTYLLDSLHAAQMRNIRVEVGSNVELQAGTTYWQATVIEKKDGKYKVRYANPGSSLLSTVWVDATQLGRWELNRRDFLKVGHCLFAALLGMIGGAVAAAFRLTRECRDPPERA